MMPRPLLTLLLVLGFGVPAALAAEPKAPATPAAAPTSDLTTYYFGLILKGPNFAAYDKEDRAKLQALHLANIERLAKLGKLLVAGPFEDNGEWRGASPIGNIRSELHAGHGGESLMPGAHQILEPDSLDAGSGDHFGTGAGQICRSGNHLSAAVV